MQKDSTLASKVLEFIRNMSLKDPLQPVGIIQECLSRCIKRQVCSRVILIHLLVNPYM
jgi:gamma-tubulin complex component 5